MINLINPFKLITRNTCNKRFSTFQRTIINMEGELRGTLLKGKYDDLPNLIFFPEALDSVQNWIPFFTNPENKFLEYRNVWLINPRNFGNSDKNPSFDMEDMTNDVVRFMHKKNISTATLAGHGFGAKLALATGCYHLDRVTGIMCIDSGPLDHRRYDAFKEFKNAIIDTASLNLKTQSEKQIYQALNEKIECPKWRKLMFQNIKKNKEGKLEFVSELNFLKDNVQFDKADSIGCWTERYGLWTGRFMAIFPEYSRWIHLNNNTMAFYKICTRVKGFGHDLFYIQGDENPLNHWTYEFDTDSYVAARKMLKFLTMYDGAHVLLQDRTEIGKVAIPDVKGSRKDPEHFYSDYIPAHYHHNWRYNKE